MEAEIDNESTQLHQNCEGGFKGPKIVIQRMKGRAIVQMTCCVLLSHVVPRLFPLLWSFLYGTYHGSNRWVHIASHEKYGSETIFG